MRKYSCKIHIWLALIESYLSYKLKCVYGQIFIWQMIFWGAIEFITMHNWWTVLISNYVIREGIPKSDTSQIYFCFLNINQIDIQFILRPLNIKTISLIIHFICVNQRTHIKIHHFPMIYLHYINMVIKDKISLPRTLSTLQLDIQSHGLLPICIFQMICK